MNSVLNPEVRSSTGGAHAEIAGLGAIALVAMALLTFGYSVRGKTADVAGAASPAVTTGVASEKPAQPASPDEPMSKPSTSRWSADEPPAAGVSPTSPVPGSGSAPAGSYGNQK